MDTINELIKNPTSLLIIAGITGLMIVFTKGGFKIGACDIPTLSTKQTWMILPTSLIVLLTGIVILIFKPPTSKPPTETPPTLPTPGQIKTPPPVEKDTIGYRFQGKLKDIFNNPLPDETVQLSLSNTKTFVDETQTDRNGIFHFSNIENKVCYRLNYKEHETTYFYEEHKQEQALCEHNPVIKFESFLCTDISPLERRPINPFNEKQLSIRSDSLKKDSDNIPEIKCFVRLFGSNNYAMDKEISLIFEWEGPETTFNYHLKAGLSESGWRAWASKKVFKGHWQLIIKTPSGRALDKFTFNIL